MADMKKLLHTFDEADEILNGKIERTNLSTIVASATASVENKKTVSIRGTGKALESLKVGGRTVQDGTPTPDAPIEVKGVGDYDEETGKYKIPVSCNGETTNVYLDAPLFDGEVADLVGGKAEKKWGLVNLEDISWNLEGNYWTGRTPVGFKKAASQDVPFSGYCSTFKIVAINPLSVSMTALAVVAAGDMFYVSNQSKTDKPVGILVYELTNSVSESFDGADIPTTAAEQEVNINTGLVPSSIEAVTFGEYYTKSEVDKMMIDAVVGRRDFLSSTIKDFIEVYLMKTTYKQFVTTGNKTSVTDSPISGWATFRFEKINDTLWTIVATAFAGDVTYMGNYNSGTITMKQVSNS